MNSEAVILILEDERPQILSLRAQLKGLGVLAEFSDPEPALEYARRHPCDAAIVDIGMPRASMDGLEFLRALRQFDRDLAIIIRTGSDSEQIADGAIELRAIKRAVKSKTTLAELRRSTQEAITETRQRRAAARSAAAASFTQSQLAEALGTYDLRQTAADLQRGLVHSLRNQLTALSALASLLQADADEAGAASGGRASAAARFSEHAAKSSALVSNMVETVNAFLDGPFGDSRGSGRGGVNECLRALRQFFQGAEQWAAEGKHLKVRDLLSDTFVESGPLELLNGLRHLVEYFFLQAPVGTGAAVTAGILLAEPLERAMADAAVVLNREAMLPGRPCVAFRVSAAIPGLSLEQFRNAFSMETPNARTGNLMLLTRVLTQSRGALLLSRSAAGVLSADALFPIAF